MNREKHRMQHRVAKQTSRSSLLDSRSGNGNCASGFAGKAIKYTVSEDATKAEVCKLKFTALRCRSRPKPKWARVERRAHGHVTAVAESKVDAGDVLSAPAGPEKSTKSRPWKCSEKNCEYFSIGWPTEKERERHMTSKHFPPAAQFKCLYPPCIYASKREEYCQLHMERAHGWERPRLFGTIGYVSNDNVDEGPGDIVRCLYCTAQFTGKYAHGNHLRHSRQKHLVMSGAPGNFVSLCRVCKHPFDREDARRNHEWTKHQLEDARPLEQRHGASGIDIFDDASSLADYRYQNVDTNDSSQANNPTQTQAYQHMLLQQRATQARIQQMMAMRQQRMQQGYEPPQGKMNIDNMSGHENGQRASLGDSEDEVVPGEDTNSMLNAHKIWEKLSSRPDFKAGTIDIDKLCSELRAKARVSERGVLVDREDVEAALRRLPNSKPGVTVQDAFGNHQSFERDLASRLGLKA
ncbi:transcription factor PAP1-domain-containing protein [Phaeosphaeria sp. MPI-PUGE-AT-0046c]|nr:transcription factor PAP1-domain-containing protein [Phaeosphaeria sp. MPI-PUGE-AT-0046c]